VSAAAGAPTTGVDFALLRRGEITGTVEGLGGTSPGSGTVRVLDSGGNTSGSGSWSEYDPDYQVIGLAPGRYTVIADSSSSHRDEVWQNHPCNGEYPEHCLHAGGDTVEVGIGGVVSGVDFTLDLLGEIRGVVVDGTDGQPLVSVNVELYDSGGFRIGSDWSSSSGEWAVDGAWPGAHFAVTNDGNPAFIDQLFDRIPCPGGPGEGCTPTAGTPIPVTYNTVVPGVDFRLQRSGGVAGQVLHEPTGVPISSCYVTAFDGDGRQVATDSTDSTGSYELRGLSTGTYFVATGSYYWDQLLDELYDDIPCLGGPPDGCDPTKGTPVAVVEGTVTRFVDFALRPWGGEGITGTVTDLAGGNPIGGVAVDFWTTSGQWRGVAMTNSSGVYVVELSAGTYRVSTDNPFGYLNEIFDNVACPGGSAYSGACDPLTGEPVVVTTDAITGDIDFALESHPLFADGFEAGATSAWSFTVP
jgi:hypothetical protein